MFLSAYRNGGTVDINAPLGLTIDDLQPYFMHVVSPAPVDHLSDERLWMLRPAALTHLLHVQPKDRPVFVKTHFSNSALSGIEAIPAPLTHGALYIVRDPRDVAVSWSEHLGKTLDETIDLMVKREFIIRRDRIFQHLAGWSEHVRSWTGQTRFPTLAVRYEDLCEHPVRAFTAILKFLRHEIDDDRLHAAIRAASFLQLRGQEDRNGFREAVNETRFFKRGHPGGWKNVLSEAQAGRIKADHGPMMAEFGYE